ncbi:MAG: hypothetical protein Q4D61_06800 [Cardiobacteriaceae bacterium]|nr:hypothetical protein [Cardiobacteriaceae bacterium]
MAFVKEMISDADMEKYQPDEYKPGVFRHWTIDRERDAYVRYLYQDREPPYFERWVFYYREIFISMEADMVHIPENKPCYTLKVYNIYYHPRVDVLRVQIDLRRLLQLMRISKEELCTVLAEGVEEDKKYSDPGKSRSYTNCWKVVFKEENLS